MKIDCHVHILGTGSSGSGCAINLRGLRWLQARFLVWNLGLPQSCLSIGGNRRRCWWSKSLEEDRSRRDAGAPRKDFDSVYVDSVVRWVRESALDCTLALACDHVRDDAGRAVPEQDAFFTPNDYVLALAQTYPELLPCVSIHPAREDALDELEKCIAGKAVAMKCLPLYHNIDCSAPRYRAFWERMAKARMVLLAHTGGELSLPVRNAALADPQVLRLPLECGVTVIAAHCGTNSLYEKNYFDGFCEMLAQYPNLYGDNSGMNTPFRSRHFKRLLEVSDRIVHGSDLPIPISAFWAKLRGLIDSAEAKRIQQERNPLQRDYLIKQALGFPPETFTRLSKLLSNS